MNLNELIEAVYTETGRPDMVSETTQYVTASIMKMHLRGRYLKDIQAAKISFDNTGHIQTLDTSTLTGYRQMIYLMPSDVNQTITTDLIPGCIPQDNRLPPLWWYFADDNPGGLIEIVEAADIFDVQGFRKQNIAYQAGSTLYIKTQRSIQYLQAAWLRYPVISSDPDVFDSWIARELPYTIIFDAAAATFVKLGQQDQSRSYNSTDPENPGLVKSWLDLLDMNNVVG